MRHKRRRAAQSAAAARRSFPNWPAVVACAGQGTPTSDSILAWLSDGEFVLRARAVRHYGLDLLNSLNGLRLPRGSLRGFNMGGLVDSLQVLMPQPMRFADGGAVPAGGPSRVLNLTIGGETFAGLIAPETVAQKISNGCD